MYSRILSSRLIRFYLNVVGYKVALSRSSGVSSLKVLSERSGI